MSSSDDTPTPNETPFDDERIDPVLFEAYARARAAAQQPRRDEDAEPPELTLDPAAMQTLQHAAQLAVLVNREVRDHADWQAIPRCAEMHDAASQLLLDCILTFKAELHILRVRQDAE